MMQIDTVRRVGRLLHPSPLRGRDERSSLLGVGGGGSGGEISLVATPLPNPPPQGGRESHGNKVQLSSSGLTGRSSTPRPLHPSPLRGRDERSSLLGVGGGGFTGRARLWLPPSPTLPRKGGGSRARRCSC